MLVGKKKQSVIKVLRGTLWIVNETVKVIIESAWNHFLTLKEGKQRQQTKNEEEDWFKTLLDDGDMESWIDQATDIVTNIETRRGGGKKRRMKE